MSIVWIDGGCIRCGKKLDQAKAVMLELNCTTGLYTDGEVPPKESQGGFYFGADCARAVLAAGGKCEPIGRHAGNRASSRRRIGPQPSKGA